MGTDVLARAHGLDEGGDGVLGDLLTETEALGVREREGRGMGRTRGKYLAKWIPTEVVESRREKGGSIYFAREVYHSLDCC